MKNIILIAALAAVFAIIGVTTAIWIDKADPAPTQAAIVLDQPRQLPEFHLVDQDNDRFSRKHFAGDWHLVFFGFTHCPAICPNTMAMMKLVDNRLREQGLSPPVMVMISVDPERDTTSAMKDFMDKFDSSYIGITGEPDQLKSLQEALYVPVRKVGLKDGSYTVDHGASLTLLDPRGEAVAFFTPPHNPDAIVNDLKILLDEG